MADPLSIAASIAGLLSLADSAFRGVFRYTQDASNAQKDIKALCTELQSVAVVLHGVKLLTETLEQDATRSSPLRLEHVHSCRAVLNEILGRIVRFDPTPGGNKSIKHAMQALKWPFGKSRTMEMVTELSRQKETLQLALQANTMADLMACLSTVQSVESKLDQIQKSVESLEVLTRIKIDDMRTKILDFFMVDDPSPNLRTSWDLRQPMTGLWLTESPRFREWLTEPRSKLWLSGIPGAGKTVLAGAVIREALNRLETTPNVGVAFFFCDYKKKSSWEILNILRALITQLGRQQDSSFQLLKEYYDKIEPQVGFRMTPEIEDLRDLFVRQANEYDQVLVVVDGLDECGDKAGEVSRMLSEVAQYARTISMALCSRHEADISDQLEVDFDHIPIAAHTQDISLYVGAELEKRIEQKRLRLGNASLKDEIMSKLIEGAQGMFRWVACQLDALCECPTDADRRAALEELPRSLPETYERILDRINQRHGRVQRLVQLSLKLIAVEEDDFKLDIPQLCLAVSTPDEIGVTLDKEAIVRDEEIARSCSSFIRKSNDGRFFEFSHFSVREYLQDSSLLQRPELALYHVSRQDAYHALAIQSLRFLLLKNFGRQFSQDFAEETWTVQRTRDQFPLYGLAVKWPFLVHCARTGATGMSQACVMLDLEKSLLHPNKSVNYRNWLISFCLYIADNDDINFELDDRNFELDEADDMVKSIVRKLLGRNISTLHIAASLNLVEVGIWLIDQGALDHGKTMAPSVLDFALAGGLSYNNGELPWIFDEYVPDIYNEPRLREALLARGQPILGPSLWDSNITMFEVAWLSVGAGGTFSSLQCVLESGWSLFPEDIWTSQDYLKTHHYENETSIFQFVVYLNSSGICTTELGRQFCGLIWAHALKLNYEFTADKSLLPLEITMPYDNIYDRAFNAVREDDLATLKACEHDSRFNHEMAILDTDEEGPSLVHVAVQEGALEVLKHLITVSSCDIEKPDSNGRTPLHYATGFREYGTDPDGHQTMMILLEAGASLLTTDNNGWNVFHHCVQHMASYRGGIGKIQKLLQHAKGMGHSLLSIPKVGWDTSESTLSKTSTSDHKSPYIVCCSEGTCVWEIAASDGSVEVIRALIDADFPRHPDHSDGRPFHSIRHILHGRRDDGYLPVMTFLSECVNGVFDLSYEDESIGYRYQNIDAEVIRALLDASPPLPSTLPQALDFCCALLQGRDRTIKEKMELIAPFLDYGFDMHPVAPSPSPLIQACTMFPFGEAAAQESRSLMRLILDHVSATKLDQQDSAGFSVLHTINKSFDADSEWLIMEISRRGANDIGNGSFLDAAQAAIIRGDCRSLRKFLQEFPWDLDSCIEWTKLTDISDSTNGELFTGLNVLHLAAWSGSLDCFNTIVGQKLYTNIRATSSQGYSCMHFAAWRGSTPMIERLHELGASIIQDSDDGSTPLHMAVRGNQNQAVHKLLELGSPLIADIAGVTPSTLAISLKSIDILGTLLKAEQPDDINVEGHMIYEKTRFGYWRLALEEAIKANDSQECERILRDGCPVDIPIPSCSGCSPLLLSLAYWTYNPFAETKLIDLFLIHSASVCKTYCTAHGSGSALGMALCLPNLYHVLPDMLDLALKDQWTCISGPLVVQMIHCNNTKALGLVLAHLKDKGGEYAHIFGCSPETVVPSVINGGAVHQAVMQNDLEAIRLLVQYGADIHALDSKGRTPLHLCKHEDIAEYLFSIGATPTLPPWSIWYGLSSKSIEGLTSLGEHVTQLASSLGNGPLFPEFLDQKSLSSFMSIGIGSHLEDAVGRSIVHLAMYSYATGSMVLNGTVQLIGSKPFPWNQMCYPTQNAAWIGPLWRYYRRRFHVDDLRRFSNLHPDRGWSPMCLATCTNDVRVMAHCLEMDADIDFEGSPYGSALMAAAFSNRLESVKYLVRSGASICYEGKDGFKSAVVIGKRCQRVIEWLIMGRFRDQDKLEGIPASSREADDSPQAMTGVWSSTLAPLRLIGHFERQPHESSLSYLHRLAIIKRDARGKVVPLPRPEVLSSMVFTATYRL